MGGGGMGEIKQRERGRFFIFLVPLMTGWKWLRKHWGFDWRLTLFLYAVSLSHHKVCFGRCELLSTHVPFGPPPPHLLLSVESILSEHIRKVGAGQMISRVVKLTWFYIYKMIIFSVRQQVNGFFNSLYVFFQNTGNIATGQTFSSQLWGCVSNSLMTHLM